MRIGRAWLAGITVAVVLTALGAGGAAAASSEPCGPAGGTAQRLLGADTAASVFGVDGSGVKVGIISNSYASNGQAEADADVAAGWLPGPGNPCGYETPVTVLAEGTAGQDDEGRAMAQIVHQVAPGAEIFVVGTQNIDEYENAITDLIAHGVSIIVDDIAVSGDRPYHVDDGGRAIQAAVDAGVFYVTAAGNYGAQGAAGYPSEGYSIGAWSTIQYRPMPCPVDVAALYPGDAIDCLDFDPSAGKDATMTLTLPPGSFMTGPLAWAEDDGHVTTSFDWVLATQGHTTKFSPSNPEDASVTTYIGNLSSPDPIENTVSVVRHVTPTAGTPPVSMTWQQAPRSEVLIDQEYYQSTDTDTIGATLFGHRANPAVFSVAAMSAITSTLETYSTLGPAPLYFGVPEATIIPGPTAVGVDNLPVSSTVLDGTGLFPGTSAAAPTVAAAAALALQHTPGLTPSQIRQTLTTHASTDAYIQPWDPSISAERSAGAGLINVAATLAALTTPSPSQPTDAPAPAATSTLAATGAPDYTWPLALAALSLVIGAAAFLTAKTPRRAAQ